MLVFTIIRIQVAIAVITVDIIFILDYEINRFWRIIVSVVDGKPYYLKGSSCFRSIGLISLKVSNQCFLNYGQVNRSPEYLTEIPKIFQENFCAIS